MALKALNLKVPRFGKNRHGVYFVRAPSQGSSKVSQQSLHTKDPRTAKILALQFCIALAKGESNLLQNPHIRLPPMPIGVIARTVLPEVQRFGLYMTFKPACTNLWIFGVGVLLILLRKDEKTFTSH